MSTASQGAKVVSAGRDGTLKELAQLHDASTADEFFFSPLKAEQVSAKKTILLVDEDGSLSFLVATDFGKEFGVAIPGKVGPDAVPGKEVLLQSTSHNRKIKQGQRIAFRGPGIVAEESKGQKRERRQHVILSLF